MIAECDFIDVVVENNGFTVYRRGRRVFHGPKHEVEDYLDALESANHPKSSWTLLLVLVFATAMFGVGAGVGIAAVSGW
jgi:hypothetical protein